MMFKYLLSFFVIIFSYPLFAQNIKIKKAIQLSGQEKIDIKLIDVVTPHKIEASLVPLFNTLVIQSVQAEGQYTITRQELVKKLIAFKKENKKLNTIKFIVPAKIDIQHFGYVINTAVVSATLKRKWAQKCPACRFVIENLTLPELTSTHQNQPWFIKAPTSLPKGRFSIPITFPNSTSKLTAWISGQAMTQKKVVTVNKNISKESPIDLASIDLDYKNITETNDAIVDLNVLTKKVSSKYLRAGDIIKTKYLVSKVVFNRGDEVKLIYKNDNLNISTSAVAESLGKVGHKVWVKSRSTNKRISGLVLSSGEVVVQ